MTSVAKQPKGIKGTGARNKSTTGHERSDAARHECVRVGDCGLRVAGGGVKADSARAEMGVSGMRSSVYVFRQRYSASASIASIASSAALTLSTASTKETGVTKTMMKMNQGTLLAYHCFACLLILPSLGCCLLGCFVSPSAEARLPLLFPLPFPFLPFSIPHPPSFPARNEEGKEKARKETQRNSEYGTGGRKGGKEEGSEQDETETTKRDTRCEETKERVGKETMKIVAACSFRKLSNSPLCLTTAAD